MPFFFCPWSLRNDSLILNKSLIFFKGVQMTTRKKLCTIKGISEAKMEKIKEAANKLCVGVGTYFAFLCCFHALVPYVPSTLQTVAMISLSGPWLSDCFGICRQKKAGLPHHNRQSRTRVNSIIFTYMILHLTVTTTFRI